MQSVHAIRCQLYIKKYEYLFTCDSPITGKTLVQERDLAGPICRPKMLSPKKFYSGGGVAVV